MWTDIRIAARTLGRAPLFAAVAILSLALGIGANTAIFSLVDQVLLRSLPVADPARLVVLHASSSFPGHSHSDSSESVFSYPIYKDLRDRSQVFDGMIARSSAEVDLSDGGATERARAEMVSGNLFAVLGVEPALGRAIAASDDLAPDASPVVMLSHGYWARRFGSSPAIIGRRLLVNAHPMVVVGIAPASFRGLVVGDPPDLYVPITMKREITPTWYALDDRRTSFLNVFARLKPGVRPEQAQAKTRVLFSALLDEFLAESKRPRDSRLGRMLSELRLDLVPAAQGVNQLKIEFKSALLALMGMVGLVLLIACANVAGLVIARAAGRQREIAVRLAIGAGRAALVRQFLVESVLLATIGGLVGLLVASWVVAGLLSAMGSGMSGGIESGLDGRLLLFDLGLSVVTGLLLGLAPALQMTRPRAIGAIRQEGVTIASGTGQARLRRGLVVAQVALSLLLLVAAGLFGRSVINLMRVDPGFRVERVTTFEVDPTPEGYPAERVYGFYRDLLDRLRGMPGVESAGAMTPGPLTNSDRGANFTLEGYQGADAGDAHIAFGMASAGLFRTLRVRVGQGREFDEQDLLGGRKVALVNEAFVRKFGQGRPLIGRRLVQGSGTDVVPDHEIVGVVGDYKHDGLREPVKPTVFFPYPQDERPSGLNFYVRSSRSEAEVAAGVRRAVRELDQNLPVFEMKPMSALIDEATMADQLIALLAAAFGILATVLAAVGLYGVIAYIVLRRTREIGVRVALGAAPGEILRLVMREVGTLIAVGLGIGLVAAVLASRLVASELFGLGANDPLVFGSALVGLTAVALVAGTIPARRAAAIDPIRALRHE